MDHTGELGLDPSRVWAGTAPNDLIDQTPVHGNDPVESDFGGNTFDVDDGSFPGADVPAPRTYRVLARCLAAAPGTTRDQRRALTMRNGQDQI
ncbi:hypothetical protein DKG71_41650 [Streptomyces sp. NEAU-S7GS2]|nr:hypothetical protein DKG71_41650 [Streptomyces sp. NEAU-S7GS2]